VDTWYRDGVAGGAMQDGCCEEEYARLSKGANSDTESARILGIFDELAFVVNLLRRVQERNQELEQQNHELKTRLSAALKHEPE
tara:strand:- start:841 stop:1092 length:252 start_codon:yes stop_codon:yes gene_type:complete